MQRALKEEAKMTTKDQFQDTLLTPTHTQPRTLSHPPMHTHLHMGAPGRELAGLAIAGAVQAGAHIIDVPQPHIAERVTCQQQRVCRVGGKTRHRLAE
jgi:hypothetical protein